MEYIFFFFQCYLLILIGKKNGFDSGPFVNFGLILFGQIYLIYLLHSGDVPVSDFYKYTLSLLFCFIGFYYATSKSSDEIVIYKNAKFFVSANLYTLLKLIFCIYLGIKLLLVYLTLVAGGGAARVIVGKSMMAYVLLDDLLQGPSYLFVVINLIRRKYLSLILILLACLFSGSKQAVLMFLFEVSFLTHCVYGYRPFKSIKLVIMALAGFILSTLMFYSNDESLFSVQKFLEYRGDIYLYLFKLNLRDNLYQAYDWSTYFFHHSLRMIGLKVYDGPIGTMLFSLSHGTPLIDTFGGPITPFYVVLDILFGNPFLLTFLIVGFSVGYISARLFIFGMRMLKNKKNILSIIIGYWLMQSYYLVIDPTVFSFKLTPVLWLVMIPLVIFYGIKFLFINKRSE